MLFMLQFLFTGFNASRIRGLGVALENWNRKEGQTQGVSLAYGINKKPVRAWMFNNSLDWQLCSCCCAQTNILLSRVNSVI